MSDLKKYNPPPGSADLYLAASKHFQQAKLILENVPSPDPEVRRLNQCKIIAKPREVLFEYRLQYIHVSKIKYNTCTSVWIHCSH